MPIDLDGSPPKKPNTRSRRKGLTGRPMEINDSVKELKSWTCKTCGRRRPLRDYYTTTDPTWDVVTSKMPVCKVCIEDAFERYYVSEGNLEKAILRLCRELNVRYDKSAVETTQKQMETAESKGKVAKGIFGIYRKSLNQGGYGGYQGGDDLTYQEGVKYDAPPLDPDEYDQETIDEMISFWGTGLEPDQYEFLESELDRYKKTHKCDTAAEESLLRQICFCELDIRKARMGGGSPPKSTIDMLQNLMKTANVDPAKAAIASAGKSRDAFSSFVKTIEENEPADYYQDKELFKDFDNVHWYFEKYVTRPLKNFITLSRDFNVEEEDKDDADFDIREASEY